MKAILKKKRRLMKVILKKRRRLMKAILKRRRSSRATKGRLKMGMRVRRRGEW